MEFIPTPTYKNVFGNEPPEISLLIGDIPSQIVITVLSVLSAELFLGRDKPELQAKLLQFVGARFSEQQRKTIALGLTGFRSAESFPVIFSEWYLTEFIFQELKEYRDLPLPPDTTPDQEFRIFQAYLIHAEKVNLMAERAMEESITNHPQDENTFFRLSWPMMAPQLNFSVKVDPIYQGFQSFVLMDYMSKRTETSTYVNNFISQKKRINYLQYISDLFALVKLSYHEDSNVRFKPFVITATPEFENILEYLSVSTSDIQNNRKLHLNYSGLRQKPLFRLADKNYVVLNWNFLYNQLYTGLLFDFHQNSGVRNIYDSFPDFKTKIISIVSEKLLLRNILSNCLNKP